MFVGSYRFIALFMAAVFANPGMQGIDVDPEIFGYLSDRLIRVVRQLDR